tara:strand:- start:679 stop:1878 length:1200 start_codon:yes stop_codon:yes gene_type:complete
MESIILTISIIIGAFSPTQLLEKMTFTDLDQAQSQLDSIATMNLTDSEKAKFHFFQGYIYEIQNDIQRAIINYRESIRHYESIEAKSPGDNTEELFYYRYHTVHYNIGGLYNTYNSPEIAIDHFEKAKKYAPAEHLPAVLYSFAQAHEKLGETQKAIDYLLESFKLSVEHGVSDYKIRSQIKLGQLLSDDGKYQESLEYLDKVLLEDSLSASLEFYARNTLGITQWKMKDYGAAEFNFKQILEIGQARNQFVTLENLCEMYLEQGFIYKAIEAGTDAEKKYIDQIINPQDAKLYTFLSDAYLAINDNKRALEYSNKFNDFMETYYERQQAALEDGDAYRIRAVTENYEKELMAAEDRKKTIQANIVVSSIILITFISLIWQQQEKKKKMVRKISEELLA